MAVEFELPRCVLKLLFQQIRVFFFVPNLHDLFIEAKGGKVKLEKLSFLELQIVV